MRVAPGSTGVTVYLAPYEADKTTLNGTGSIRYRREGSASVADAAIPAYSAADDEWSAVVPNAAFASGATGVKVMFTDDDGVFTAGYIELDIANSTVNTNAATAATEATAAAAGVGILNQVGSTPVTSPDDFKADVSGVGGLTQQQVADAVHETIPTNGTEAAGTILGRLSALLKVGKR